MTSKILCFVLCFTTALYAQDINFTEKELSINKNIVGVLLTPQVKNPPLVILLSGSGPNDRDGNSNIVKGFMLKKLAEALTKNGIATYRYDKRNFKQIKERALDENMKFDAFIEDASVSLEFFKSKHQFSNIYILGHSQGSLVGMIAARGKADGFVSVAGPAFSIDETITQQVIASAPLFGPETKRIFGLLKEGKTIDKYPPALASIFDKRNQPFLMSWMKYHPQEEIKKLNIPTLIINGTNDVQITEEDANLLHKAQPKGTLKIIKNLNHALVIFEGKDRLANMKSYNETQRPLSEELINTLTNFIK